MIASVAERRDADPARCLQVLACPHVPAAGDLSSVAVCSSLTLRVAHCGAHVFDHLFEVSLAFFESPALHCPQPIVLCAAARLGETECRCKSAALLYAIKPKIEPGVVHAQQLRGSPAGCVAGPYPGLARYDGVFRTNRATLPCIIVLCIRLRAAGPTHAVIRDEAIAPSPTL